MNRSAANDENRLSCSRTVYQVVIPAKTRVTGLEPESREFKMIPVSWIPDLTSLRSVPPE